MPQLSAVTCSALDASGECTEMAHVLQEAKALVEGSASELPRHEYEMLAAYVASHRTATVEYHQLLARALSASPVASQAFACFPAQMAELCLEALRCGTDTVRELIDQYRLRTQACAGDSR